jgi:hypothetical protein
MKLRCLACNGNLSDKEAGRKFSNWRLIKNSEERYIGLCTGCISDTDLMVVDNPLLDDVVYPDEPRKAEDGPPLLE